MKIAIVSGAVANKLAKGGEVWVRLSYVRGLQRLGFDVYFVEQIAASACTDERSQPTSFEKSANRLYFQEVMGYFGLEERAVLLCDNGQLSGAIRMSQLFELAENAELLINVTGHLTLEAIKTRVRHRIYVDIDPGFTQFWHAAGDPGPRLAGHDHYFTIGENIGTANCFVPVEGLPWRATRPPVVLSDWPYVPSQSFQGFTTIASWRGAYGPIEFGGKTFGLKVHEFRRFMDMPSRTSERFEVALDIHPGDSKDLDRLVEHGWNVTDPRVAASAEGFRGYIQGSSAEFSVAQRIYVETHSGWFSDRTVRYLASGKPALIQDTGFTRNYPVGAGLLAFRTLEEAAGGVQSIRDAKGKTTHPR